MNASLVVVVLVGLFVVAGFATTFYTVEPDEEAVVLRFGKYIKTVQPGPHFKLPWGIDEAIKVKTKLVLQEEFGFRTKNVSGNRTSYSNKSFNEESVMLTGDLNVADVEWIVQYQISEPKKFLFHTRNAPKNLRDVSEAVMRRVVGDRTVDEILTVGRAEIADDAQRLMEEILVKYDMGVRLVSVKLQDVNPPEAVKASFNEVNAAKQDQEKAINQAEKEYNRVIPEARGKAKQTIAEAEGFAARVVNRAQGDADKFRQVAAAYRGAPDITRERLYLETIEEIFEGMEELTIVDANVKGLMPVFGENGRINLRRRQASTGNSKAAVVQ